MFDTISNYYIIYQYILHSTQEMYVIDLGERVRGKEGEIDM